MSLVKPLIDHAAAELDTENANWEEFSAVLGISPKGKANDSWGCWFGLEPNSPPESFAVAPRAVREDLKTYLDDLYPDGNYPIRVLLQFNRTSGRYNIEFEDTDTRRWFISPANYQQAKEALRPNLG